MKKIICMSFVFAMCFNVYAKQNNNLEITSPNCILMDQTTKRVLYAKAERQKVKIASTTKILTAIVAIENCNLEDMVKVSKKAALTGGSKVGIRSGTEIPLKTLMYGMLLKSGNDCAVAIAEHVAGNVDNFAKMMNEKAYEIGAKDSNFTNPHGLDTDSNYSTAYDLALIMSYAKQNEELSKILKTESITLDFSGREKYLANTNKLLFTYEYCDGGKTGFTGLANKCLVVSATKDDLKIVAVVLGAENTNKRFNEAKALLKYGIENYKMIDVKEDINWYIDIPVIKGNILSYVKKFKIDTKLPLKENEKEKIYISQNVVPSLVAPVKLGTNLGDIALYIGDEKIYSKKIYLDEEIKKNTVWDYLLKELKTIFEVNFEI